MILATDRVVLTEAGPALSRRRPGPSARRVVLVTAAVAAVIIAVVSVAGLLVSRHIAERQAVHDVAQLTDSLAQSVVQPVLTDAMATDPQLARRVLDPIVRGRLLTGSLVRVKLWTPRGTVLYSDESRLIGKTFTLDEDARAIFTDPRIQAYVTDLRRPENRYERNQGKLLEVYRPVWTPDGEPLLFESYFRYDTVTARSHELWRGFAGIMLSSVAALILLLVPLAWLVFARARRGQIEREQLMSRALAASDEERRRIAGSLHDGVVQQLAAASFSVAGHAEQAAANHQDGLATGLTAAGATIRDAIAGLRSLLVDIYPASLQTAGLEAALQDLARSASANDATVTVAVEADAADALSPAASEAAYRVAQEAVRNALRHGLAHNVHISVTVAAEERVHLVVEDDGVGFDPAAATRETQSGHFGLQLMTETARSCGAGLVITSAPGCGARLEFTAVTT
jgi:signal transduction histidine kinase